MGFERIKYLLEPSETPPSVTAKNDMRQQITPSMRFTCNGVITKWIFGAEWSNQVAIIQHPELQVWRDIGNNTYKKVHETKLRNISQNDNRTYEYGNFQPIEVKVGDIFGMYVPPVSLSTLQLLSEGRDAPTNYYLPLSQETVIDITPSAPPFMQQNYHPLVSGIKLHSALLRSNLLDFCFLTVLTESYESDMAVSTLVSNMTPLHCNSNTHTDDHIIGYSHSYWSMLCTTSCDRHSCYCLPVPAKINKRDK